MDAQEAAAYLGRIGMAAPPAPDPAGLAAVVQAHRLAIPFENLDILLGRGISLDQQAVFAKLVTARRGGYCFEHNLLLSRMLAHFGLPTEPLLARVRMGLPEGTVPPRTHLLLMARIGGQTWLADAGFGGGYGPPMILAETDPVAGPDGVLHRLRRVGERGSEAGEWLLERSADGAATWQAQYSFDAVPVPRADIDCANHWTATRPDTRFTTLHIASRVTPTGMAALTDHQFSATGEDGRTVTDPRQWRCLLNETFAIPLDADEIAALPLFSGVSRSS